MLTRCDLVGTAFALGEIGPCMEQLVEVALTPLSQDPKNDAALVEPPATQGSNLPGITGPGYD